MSDKSKNKKKAEQQYYHSIEDLVAYAERLGKELDNPPVNLDRGTFVGGAISFGSLILDLITGGGAPPGKFANVFGLQGSSKSTCCYHLMANAMALNIPVFFFDHEASADGKYIQSVGIKVRKPDGSKNPLFTYFQPTTGESTYRLMNRLLRAIPDYEATDNGSRPYPKALIVTDSLAAMLPEQIDEDDENIRMAAVAALHSQYMPLIKPKLGRKNVTWFATNQTRLRPGVVYGNPEYEPGGQATEFYPDLKIRFQAVGKPFEERNRLMRFVNISTKKNKQFVPFLECKDTLAVAFGRGYERGRDSLGFLELTQQIETHGSRKQLVLDLSAFEDQGDADLAAGWNSKSYYLDDLMPILCSNAFRRVCRAQLENGLAFDRYFAANKWDNMYSIDEEAAQDDVSVVDELSESVSESEKLEKNIKRSPVDSAPAKKRGRPKKVDA